MIYGFTQKPELVLQPQPAMWYDGTNIEQISEWTRTDPGFNMVISKIVAPEGAAGCWVVKSYDGLRLLSDEQARKLYDGVP